MKVDATQKKLAAARDDVRHSAVLLYRHGDGAAMIGLLGSTDGSGELVEGKHYLQRVSDKRQDDARRVTKLKEQLDAQQQDAVGAAEAGRRRRARRGRRREGAARRARRAAGSSARDAADERGAGRERRARRRGRTARRGRGRARGRVRSASPQLAQSAGDGPALGDGTFIRPVPGPITSGFGYRTDPITGATAFHSGLDIGAPCGTPIKAAGTGVILTAGFNSGGYGNMTLINHGNGLSTLYGHQSSIIVSTGQSVTQGQVIGYVGSTGKSTGCHLHFEVRVERQPGRPERLSLS